MAWKVREKTRNIRNGQEKSKLNLCITQSVYTAGEAGFIDRLSRLHLDTKLKETAHGLYALIVLKSHGLKHENLWDITKATLVSKLLYASPVWWGFADSETKIQLQSTLQKLIKLGFLPKNHPPFDLFCEKADDSLFSSILVNETHVLHPLLPPLKICPTH